MSCGGNVMSLFCDMLPIFVIGPCHEIEAKTLVFRGIPDPAVDGIPIANESGIENYQFMDRFSMHSKDLGPIAAWAAFNSSSLVHGGDSQTVFAANKYWTASKCRLQRWMAALRLFENDLQSNPPRHNPWPAIEIVLEEVLLAEILTRVWAAIMVTHDKLHNTDELSGVAHSTPCQSN